MSFEQEGFDRSVLSGPDNKVGLLGYEHAERQLEAVRLTTDGNSSLVVARQGAALHELVIGGDTLLTSAAVDWLGTSRAKRDTSHSVLPFGPNGLQPQHGASRYLDYDIDAAIGSQVAMGAYDRLLDVGHRQLIKLGRTGVAIADEVINLGSEDRSLSFGKHLYFAVPESEIGDMRVYDMSEGSDLLTVRRPNGVTVDGPFSSFYDLVEAGEPLVMGSSGLLRLQMADGRDCLLIAQAYANNRSQPVQFALWHREGTDTMCIEPLTGVAVGEDGTFHNDRALISPGNELRMDIRLHQLMPAHQHRHRDVF